MKNTMALLATLSMCLSLAAPAMAHGDDDCCKEKAAKKECKKSKGCPKKNKEASTDSKAETKDADAKAGEAKEDGEKAK